MVQLGFSLASIPKKVLNDASESAGIDPEFELLNS